MIDNLQVQQVKLLVLPETMHNNNIKSTLLDKEMISLKQNWILYHDKMDVAKMIIIRVAALNPSIIAQFL